MIEESRLGQLQDALVAADVDGWLLFDFHGVNPVPAGLLQLPGMVTRRYFVFIPRTGNPVALTHAIEQGPWRDWPSSWGKVSYAGWKQLEDHLHEIVGGKRVAMEYSAGDAIPYLDRIPAGVIELVRNAGATVVSSADLVTRFYAVWTIAQLESHKRAAEVIATIGQDAIRLAGERAAANPITEFELQKWILDRFAERKLESQHDLIVAVGPNAANPHYAPTEARPVAISRGDILLVDLWAREPGGVFADQTWMASLGEPSARNIEVWSAIRDARDAAITLLEERLAAQTPVRGAEVDDAARKVIGARGFGEYFIHRTGHSIDPRDLHGSGPHMDNYETREERLLLPGVGFSIEPGIYIPGEVGMRTEVNGFVGETGLVITPSVYQRDLIVV